MEKWIADALLEDRAFEDCTAQATIAEHAQGVAVITAKAKGCLSGVALAKQVFDSVPGKIEQQWHVDDGQRVASGQPLASLQGDVRLLLALERTALNILQHLSGIATTTREYVDAIRGTDCVVADTRKTIPGWRLLEKQAVTHGGGMNHRYHLADAMLIKENHIAATGSLSEAIRRCQQESKGRVVEVEVENFEQLIEAIKCKPDMILLDNMTVEDVRQARNLVPKEIILEASGGIHLGNVLHYALTGVDRVAIGAITHSAPALDVSMRIDD